MALTHWKTLKQMPRRLWWGVGLAVLIIVFIIGGIKLGYRFASQPQSARLTVPFTFEPMGGGPPLIETGETGAPREAVPSPRKVSIKAPAGGSAIPGEAPRAKEDRYLLLIATYANLKQAEALQQRLRAKKINAVIIKRKTGDKILYLVQVGAVTGAKTAEDTANRIQSQEKVTPKVVKLSPRTGGDGQARKSSR